MPIAVISRSAVFSDILVSVCIGRGLEISGTYPSLSDLSNVRPGDVVLLHVQEHIDDLASGLTKLLDRFSGVRVVVLVPASEADRLYTALQDIVAAIIPETTPAEALISALILAQQGFWMTRGQKPPVARQADDSLHAAAAENPNGSGNTVHQLSKREMAILAHLRSGVSNKGIAKALGISDATVKVHLRTSFRKIGAANRTQAAMWAEKHL